MPTEIDCPTCDGARIVIEPCCHEDCMRRISHEHEETCLMCEGRGGGFRCLCCGAFQEFPVCDTCQLTWTEEDDFAHRQFHGAGSR